MVEIQSKNRFSGTFLGVFGFHPLTPYELQHNFWLIKGLIEIHKRGKFHQYSICRSEVIYPQGFLQQQKVGFFADFGTLLGHNSPQYGKIVLKG